MHSKKFVFFCIIFVPVSILVLYFMDQLAFKLIGLFSELEQYRYPVRVGMGVLAYVFDVILAYYLLSYFYYRTYPGTPVER